MKKLTIIFSCAILLVLVYIASYSLDVRRGNGRFLIRLAGHYEEGQKLPVSASYRFGGHWAEMIYHPLQLIDRHVRPEYWNFTFHQM